MIKLENSFFFSSRHAYIKCPEDSKTLSEALRHSGSAVQELVFDGRTQAQPFPSAERPLHLLLLSPLPSVLVGLALPLWKPVCYQKLLHTSSSETPVMDRESLWFWIRGLTAVLESQGEVVTRPLSGPRVVLRK